MSTADYKLFSITMIGSVPHMSSYPDFYMEIIRYLQLTRPLVLLLPFLVHTVHTAL